MNKILVTGANGQLGSELKKLSNYHPDLSFFFIDIEDLDLTKKKDVIVFCEKNSFDWIINCAAYTAVDKAESDKELAEKVNSGSVANIVEAAKINSSSIIHISTDFVFDGNKSFPYVEEDATGPLGVYGATKLNGEKLLINSYDKYYILRTSWLYSAFGNNFVKTMIRLACERDELGIIFDQIGSPTYAADLAKTILTIIQSSMHSFNRFGIYHYSNEGVASWYDFTKAIVELKGLDCNIKPIETSDYPTPAVRPKYSVMNKKKIKETFNITIPYWRDSLKECLKNL